jgi:hypothetical protein
MATYQKMKCTPLNGQSLGNLCYLSTYERWADVTDSANAEQLQWSQENGALYLKAAHYLGNQDGQAHWGSSGVALDRNADGTISLASSPSRKLYYTNWTADRKAVYWTNAGESHANLLKFESGLVVTHDCRLSPGSSSTSDDVWEHSMDGGTTWKIMRADSTTSSMTYYCDLEIPADAIQLKLKIHNNCSRKFRIYVYNVSDNTQNPAFGHIDISNGQFKSFVFDVSGGSLPYKTQGPYLDVNNRVIGQVPDPKFTITRRGG